MNKKLDEHSEKIEEYFAKDRHNNKKSYDHYKYGIDDIFLISCAHRLGFDKLLKFLKSSITIDSITEDFAIGISSN